MSRQLSYENPPAHRTAKICGLIFLGGCGLAISQVDDAPIISLIEAERLIEAQVETESGSTIDLNSTDAAGPFSQTVADTGAGSMGSSGDAAAGQETQISNFSISGSGNVDMSTDLGNEAGAEVDVLAESRVSAEFTVPVDGRYSLIGSFEASRTDAAEVFGNVSFAGFSPTGVFFHTSGYNPDLPPEDRAFFFEGTAAANQPLNFGIAVIAAAFGNDQFGTAFLGDGSASFEFELSFGDRDGDGLLDQWEERGIDFDGVAPPDIDLPGMGADPDVKDLFVELDVMAGVLFDQSAIDAVTDAFARAPAAAVDNPDGSEGIQLHVMVDGDRPAHTALLGLEGMPEEFYAIKTAFFGSEEDRDHPNWLAIRAARLLIFRYCLWADTLEVEFLSPPQTVEALGLAEAIPSNDFIIAAGDIAASYTTFVSEKLAGTFMHEFGHTLGLRHGGRDTENFKPNYLSVMNYAYAVPYDETTAQGTNIGDYWQLDYSRTAMIELDETALNENQGLGGPAGRAVYFNSAGETEFEPVQRAASRADWPYVNWNANDDQTEGPYQLDITRQSASADPDYDSTLNSYPDWNRIYYALSGTEDFENKSLSPLPEKSPPLEKDLLDEFHNTSWTDLVVRGELVFADSFE